MVGLGYRQARVDVPVRRWAGKRVLQARFYSFNSTSKPP